MFVSIDMRHKIVAVLAALSLLAGTQSLAAGEIKNPRKDILDTPARITQRAQTAVLTAVAIAGKRLVAVGEMGIVLLSDDNGLAWRQAKAVPTSVELTNVYFISDKTGWAVGHSGVVLKTTDSGENWLRVLDGKLAAEVELAAADAAAPKNGEPATTRQHDAQRLVADGADKPFFDVHFYDEQRGMVTGAYGLAFATHDGGKTWESLMGLIDNPKNRHLYSITPFGADSLIAGEQGTLYRMTEAGQRFSALKIPYVGTLFGALEAGSNMLVYGLRGNAYRSTDQGVNWTKIDFGPHLTLTAGLKLRDGRLVVVDEGGRVMVSSDGGAQFSSLPIPKMSAATGLVEAADGALVVSTQRGAVRVAVAANKTENK